MPSAVSEGKEFGISSACRPAALGVAPPARLTRAPVHSCGHAALLAPCQLHHRGCAAVAAPSPLRAGHPSLEDALHLGGITLQRWSQHTACSTNEGGRAAPSSLQCLLGLLGRLALEACYVCWVLASSREFIHRPRRSGDSSATEC